MEPIVTPEEMAAADRRAVESGTPTGVLMDRAGRAVARAARDLLGASYGARVVVVVGRGNNGGDGLVAARTLRSWGVRTDVFELVPGVDRARMSRAIARADLSVDAMFGTGFRGALDGDAAWAAGALLDGPPVLSVDIPSGVQGGTGAVDGTAVRALRTICLAAWKPGLLVEPGATHAGMVRIEDIGIEVGQPGAALVTAADVRGWLPRRPPAAHKWLSGVMVVGGSGGMTGAPSMVSRAAMRAGAGIVWCGLPGHEAAARASGGEVITKPLPAGTEGALRVEAADAVLETIGRFRALVVGPGLGVSDPTAAAARRLAAAAPVALVLDADGLNALRGDLDPLRARHAAGRPLAVLTPHEGEYARLVGHPVGADRIAAARELAAAAHAVVLLKGPTTVVAAPGGTVRVSRTGGPWLATAGTGDVLSGIVGGFLARGVPPLEAAAAGAWVHGRAADFAGHTGLVAGDLVDALPATLTRLEP